MAIIAAFWAFLLSSIGVFFILGNFYERKFATYVIFATAFTFSANSLLGMNKATYLLLIIDICLFICAFNILFKTDRYWPIWFCGFHLNAIATEVASIINSDYLSYVYANFAGIWALPALGTGAIGVMLDHRAGLVTQESP